MRRMDKTARRKAAIKKELEVLQKKEANLAKAAGRGGAPSVSGRLEEKIPEKVRITLEKAFCRAFAVVFEKGTGVIGKSFNKEKISEDYSIQNYAVQVKGTRRELRRMKTGAQMAGAGNLALTTAEGIGLGVLGIGLPDIVAFTGVLLKGIYETALRYGIDYRTREERLLILMMMEAAVSKKGDWERRNTQVDEYMKHMKPGLNPECTDDIIRMQTERTARAFAADMLLLKFVQGFPLIGILGGAGNPIYYHKVLQYVGIKYQKRYLWRVDTETDTEADTETDK